MATYFSSRRYYFFPLRLRITAPQTQLFSQILRSDLPNHQLLNLDLYLSREVVRSGDHLGIGGESAGCCVLPPHTVPLE